MNYRPLGSTGLQVSEIGFGAWGIGKSMWMGADDQESLRALHRAADLGVNFFDSARVYGDGHSERLIGRFLKERSEEIVVASKIPPKEQPVAGASQHDGRADLPPRSHPADYRGEPPESGPGVH